MSNSTYPKIGRYFVNQPSTRQPYHRFHGQNVVATPTDDPKVARVMTLGSDNVSLDMDWAALSPIDAGWRGSEMNPAGWQTQPPTHALEDFSWVKNLPEAGRQIREEARMLENNKLELLCLEKRLRKRESEFADKLSGLWSSAEIAEAKAATPVE